MAWTERGRPGIGKESGAPRRTWRRRGGVVFGLCGPASRSARRLNRTVLCWALLAHSVPFASLYALLFADHGMTAGQISALFAIWSLVAVLGEVPSGAFADRFSRRTSLVLSGVLRACGCLLWIAAPSFAAFAAGFVLWGLGGALVSGALQALVYDALAVLGVASWYQRLMGRVTAVELLSQVPAALAAFALFRAGGYAAVGWASVACALAASAVATLVPERRLATGGSARTYLGIVRAGIAEVTAQPAVRIAVAMLVLLTGAEAVEEYFPLLARGAGVPTAVVPLVVLVIACCGALGALWAGAVPASRITRVLLLAGCIAALAVTGSGQQLGLVALGLFYALYQGVGVLLDARMQHLITGPARATVTSMAGLLAELIALAGYASWAIGELTGLVLFTATLMAFVLLLDLLSGSS